MTTITFVGAGSTVFARTIAADVLHRPALRDAEIRLMDIDPVRLEESRVVVGRLIEALGAPATLTTHRDRREALDGADFVVTCFQVGGYDPCTITDFEVPKRFGLRQTIGDTLGIGGIMRGLRTAPHLWAVCEDMAQVCPDAVLLQHVNPMAILTWAVAERHPEIRQVGLCHSVQGTAAELARELDLDPAALRFRVGGINHMAFFLTLEERLPGGGARDLYPALRRGHREGRLPRFHGHAGRCPNRVRFEAMRRLGYFVTESSEHFAEYVPWFIKRDRPDLIERYGVPLDEYPRRCVEQIEAWRDEARDGADAPPPGPSHEYATAVMNAMVTGEPAVIHANVPNAGLIPQLPEGCAVEVPVLVDANGPQPTAVHGIPPQLVALMRTNINVQELTVRALLDERREHIHHAAMMDPHTAAELDLDQIWALVDALLEAHGDWLPAFARPALRRAS